MDTIHQPVRCDDGCRHHAPGAIISAREQAEGLILLADEAGQNPYEPILPSDPMTIRELADVIHEIHAAYSLEEGSATADALVDTFRELCMTLAREYGQAHPGAAEARMRERLGQRIGSLLREAFGDAVRFTVADDETTSVHPTEPLPAGVTVAPGFIYRRGI